MYLRGMLKSIMILGIVASCLSFYAQEAVLVKRKWLGTYNGIVPAYRLNTGNELLDVESDNLSIILSKASFSISFGAFSYTGQYTTVVKNKNKLRIEGKIEGRTVNEYFLIDRKKKQLTRSGIIPQPDSTLDKLRKKQGK